MYPFDLFKILGRPFVYMIFINSSEKQAVWSLLCLTAKEIEAQRVFGNFQKLHTRKGYSQSGIKDPLQPRHLSSKSSWLQATPGPDKIAMWTAFTYLRLRLRTFSA